MPLTPPAAGADPVPAGSYDPGAVAAAARRQDPGLPPETASLLAPQAWDLLRRQGDLDAPALARALMAGNPGIGATPANVVAIAAVSFCKEHGLRP